jgi:p-hydroxybenzoate 3-monooxygenase
VLIAGAGPAGLVLANALLRAGVNCVVMERRERAPVEARAGILLADTVAVLDRLRLAGPLLASAGRQASCEFRTPDEQFVLTYPDAHYVYPQHLLVRDLIEAYTSGGGDIRFASAVAPTAVERPAGELLIDCAGRHGPARSLFPRVVRHYPHRWRSVLVGAPAATPHLTYALHPDGFAGQMPRGPGSTRYYLQEPIASDLFVALEHRLGVPVPRGPVLSQDRVGMTASIASRMSDGRVHLAGDAAHAVPPTGAKGLNLAVADAADLADAIVNRDRLAGYEQRRLAATWQTVEFVDWLLTLLDVPPDPYRYRLNRARLSRLRDSPQLAAWFTRAYSGPIGPL